MAARSRRFSDGRRGRLPPTRPDEGLFDGDLTLEGSNVLFHAYPLYTRGSGKTARLAVDALHGFGIESLEQQSILQYWPAARQSTLKAEEALAERGPRRRTVQG